MIRNYLRIAIRTIRKNFFFSLINISGLSLGLISSFLLISYVSQELSYDQFHEDASAIYRVTIDIEKSGADEIQSARVAPAVAPAFQQAYPEITDFTRMVILGPDAVLTAGEKFVGEKEVYLADSSFFDIFSYKLIRGNSQTALNDPFGIIITESTAEKLFGEKDALGEEVIMNAANFDNTSLPFTVTGVIANFPANTHLKPSVLISYPTLFEFVGHRFDDSWTWNETYTYVRLNPGTDPMKLEAGFPKIVRANNEKLLEAEQTYWQFHLQPVTDIHLHSNLQHESGVNGNWYYVVILGLVSLVILFIAYINFINLVTVKALNRGKEVGVRKVSGARRGQLIFQFFTESTLLNLFALFLSVTILQIGSPWFRDLFALQSVFHFSQNMVLWIGLGAYLLLLIAGSGFYPAFILSYQKPVNSILGLTRTGRSGVRMRKVLVTCQFIASMVILALTLAAALQVNFMQKQSLGFDPDQVLVIKGPKSYDYGYNSNLAAFDASTGHLASVISTSGSMVVPGQEIYLYNDNLQLNGESANGIFSVNYVDPGYFDHYGIPLLAGREFNDLQQDEWIINESAMYQLGIDSPEKAINQTIQRDGHAGVIMGVASDFHHQSLKESISPTLFRNGGNFNYYSVRLNTPTPSAAIKDIKEAWSKTFPGSPFDYFFLDQYFNQQYKSEQEFNLLFRIFSGLAVVITILGLLGLAGYSARQKTKEIGIRKVYGASVISILALLSRDVVRMVLYASIIALPIAYWLIDMWLEYYAYQISISWWLLIPVGLLLLITILTVGLQSFRTAVTTPVRSLRHE